MCEGQPLLLLLLDIAMCSGCLRRLRPFCPRLLYAAAAAADPGAHPSSGADRMRLHTVRCNTHGLRCRKSGCRLLLEQAMLLHG